MITHSFSHPEIGFFNDVYRDMMRGSASLNSPARGFLMGDMTYSSGFEYAFMGSSVGHLYPPRFLLPAQSINYVECHDNATLFDKVNKVYGYSTPLTLRVIKLINSVVLLSFGVPFIHMGQEIGQSKDNHENTYNEGDYFNQFQVDTRRLHEDMVMSFRNACTLRSTYPFFQCNDPKLIEQCIHFVKLDYGEEIIYTKPLCAPFNEVRLIINNSTSFQEFIAPSQFAILFKDGQIITNPTRFYSFEVSPVDILAIFA
jgi:pullulanase